MCDYVTFNGKRDFANVIKLMILPKGELSRWAKFNHKGSYKEKAGGNVTLETDGSVVAMRQGMQAASGCRVRRGMDSALEPAEPAVRTPILAL